MVSRRLFALLLLLPLGGCMHGGGLDGETHVTHAVRERAQLVEATALDDGLSEVDAVHLALLNNAAFQELLGDLGLAQADLVQAGLLPNPEVLYVFGTGAKPFKYAFELPLDAILLRPLRTNAATADIDRVRERLTQAGLDLVRDARLAYADWAFAHERVTIAEENRQLRERINTLTEARFKAGDATPLEVSTARIDNLRAKQEATRAKNDLPVFEERLRNVTGLGVNRPDLKPEKTAAAMQPATEVNALTAEAMLSRPDVLAAEAGIAAADARIRLARLGWLRILGIGDATSGDNGREFSPGLRVALPLFNWNQGGIARAEAERERAVRTLQAARERVALEVRLAHSLNAQAAVDYRQWTKDIRPAVELAVRQAENTYKEGGTSLLLVLETSRQMIDTRSREAQLRADLLRTWAELERAVGRKITATTGFATER